MAGKTHKDVLFVTWDGPGSPFLAGLFLPIFAALRDHGYRFHVLQFSWSDESERRLLRAACEAANVSYRAASILRRLVGPGALATALLGAKHVRQAVRDHDVDILMPRSTLPAVAALRGGDGLPLLLDADGLPHDERVEFGGGSRSDLSYRLLRRLEAWSVRAADAVTVRTRRAAEILSARARLEDGTDRFHVVANARDEHRFAPMKAAERDAKRRELGLGEGQPLLLFAASSLGWKNDGDAMLRFFAEVRKRRDDARLLLLLPDHREAEQALARFPELKDHCIFRSAAPAEVPTWIGCADLGLALMHGSFSLQAVAPVKVGEYLLCGVPVLASAAVGDTCDIIDSGIGLCLEQADERSLAAAADWFVTRVLADRSGFMRRCRAAGLEHFALSSAVDAYAQALDAAERRHRR